MTPELELRFHRYNPILVLERRLRLTMRVFLVGVFACEIATMVLR